VSVNLLPSLRRLLYLPSPSGNSGIGFYGRPDQAEVFKLTAPPLCIRRDARSLRNQMNTLILINMKYTKFISILKSFKGGNIQEPMVSLDNSFELSGLLKGLGWRIVFATFPDIIKISSRLKQLSLFNKYLLAMTKHHGSTTTVKFLKLSALALQRKIAGTPAHSYRELDSELPLPRLYSGLPRFIPIEDRRAILRGNPFVIR